MATLGDLGRYAHGRRCKIISLGKRLGKRCHCNGKFRRMAVCKSAIARYRKR